MLFNIKKRFIYSFLFWGMGLFLTPLMALTPAEQLQIYQNLPPDQQAKARAAMAGEGGATAAAPLTEPVVVIPEPAKKVAEKKEVQASFQKALDKPELIEKPQSNSVQNKPLQPFGYELFAGSPTTFAPATDIPVPSNYVIGPGDTVEIALYGASNLQFKLTVSREGLLNIPDIGPISVAGQNYSEMVQMLHQEIKRTRVGVKANITMGPLRSIRIFVMGEANRPGSYTVSSLSTMTNALFVSGGVSSSGSLRLIELKRQGNSLGFFDLYELLLNGDTSGDLRLQPGDVIFIPPVGDTVGIAGKVRRPGIYELKRETNVGRLIDMAGGLLPDAFPAATQIERIDTRGDQRSLIDIGFKRGGEGFKTTLDNGDVVRIYSVNERSENMVDVVGHVPRPGAVQWRQGMRIADLFESVDDLLPLTVPDYLVVEREKPPLRELEILVSRLDKALANPESAFNLRLKARDRVRLFALGENRSDSLKKTNQRLMSQARFGENGRVVNIDGIVRFSGQYPLTKNMRVSDLVSASGGLKTNNQANYIILQRINPENGRSQVQQIDIGVLMQPGSEMDLTLEPLDQITLFSDFTPRAEKLKPLINTLSAQTLNGESAAVTSVTGIVRFPGQYPLTSSMKVSDLVNAAGGLKANNKASYIIVQRINPENGRSRVLQIGVEALLQPSSNEDILLEPRDQLSLFSDFDPRAEELKPLINTLRSQARDGESAAVTTISGIVRYPGEYPLANSMHLNDLIEAAGGFKADSELGYLLLVRKDAADGRLSVESLQPEELNQREEARNLLLQPNDQLYLFADRTPRSETLEPIVSSIRAQARIGEPALLVQVSGIVKQSGSYPLTNGMKVSDLLKIGVMGESANLLTAELTRYRLENEQIHRHETVVLHPGDILSGKAEDIVLKPFDRLLVKQIEQWKEEREIELLGEFRFPGIYRFGKGETLEALIERAGGLNEYADPSASLFLRKSLLEKEKRRIQELEKQIQSEVASLALQERDTSGGNKTSIAETSAMLDTLSKQLSAVDPQGRLVIELPKFINGESSLTLEAGDRLFVPVAPIEVTVIGQVNYPTSHYHDSSMTLNDYVNKSGGITEKANEDMVYIVRANGAIDSVGSLSWWANMSAEIRSGDTIVVPQDIDRISTLSLWTSVTQIVYQLGVAAAAWKTVGAF